MLNVDVDFQREVSVVRMAAYAEATERFVEIPGIVEIRWVGLASPSEGLICDVTSWDVMLGHGK